MTRRIESSRTTVWRVLLLLIALAGVCPAADRVVRPAPKHPEYSEARLTELGIQRYESKRLRLFTDVDAEKVHSLPALIDQAYEAWSAYFGPLPPAADGSEFQITAYLMKEADRFRAAKMLRDDVPPFDHGRNIGLELWMNEQEFDYYREHLLLHEATHCFMTAMPGGDEPIWYHEGMAELFGCHHRGKNGQTAFAVFPQPGQSYDGFGRIKFLTDEIAAGRAMNANEVASMGPRDFAGFAKRPYAWNWALCSFLDKHPAYRDRFHELARHHLEPGFIRRVHAAYEDDPHLGLEWKLFMTHIDPGYDFERAAIEFKNGAPFERPTEVLIRADRGWQSTGLTLERGKSYVIIAKGRATLGASTKPWISESGGISIRYAGGRPIGTLLAAVVGDLKQVGGEGGLLKPLAAGSSTIIEPATTGTLYLRINDRFSSLDDNEGAYHVTVRLE